MASADFIWMASNSSISGKSYSYQLDLSLIERGPKEVYSIAFFLFREAAVDVQKQFGKRLAALRKAKGWSQEALALESGIARSYLGGVERGQRNIALVNICRLADALNLKPSVLLDFEDKGANTLNP